MAGNLHEFTDANFESEVLKADGPVLVDFWAPWCGPCQRLTPTIEQLATEYSGKVKVGKLHTDDNPKTASGQSISALPTVALFHNGAIVDRVVGLAPKASFDAMIKKVL